MRNVNTEVRGPPRWRRGREKGNEVSRQQVLAVNIVEEEVQLQPQLHLKKILESQCPGHLLCKSLYIDRIDRIEYLLVKS